MYYFNCSPHTLLRNHLKCLTYFLHYLSKYNIWHIQIHVTYIYIYKIIHQTPLTSPHNPRMKSLPITWHASVWSSLTLFTLPPDITNHYLEFCTCHYFVFKKNFFKSHMINGKTIYWLVLLVFKIYENMTCSILKLGTFCCCCIPKFQPYGSA